MVSSLNLKDNFENYTAHCGKEHKTLLLTKMIITIFNRNYTFYSPSILPLKRHFICFRITTRNSTFLIYNLDFI